MKLNKSYLIAFVLFAIIGIWFLVNNIGDEAAPEGLSQADVQAERLEKIATVQIKSITAEEHENVLSLYGQTEAAREVMVKAQTAGPIAQTPIAEGTRVKRGTLLCRQSIEARGARVDQAKANLRSIESDLRGARVLAEKGFQSETRVINFEAQRDGAMAVLKQAEIELGLVNIRAPFSGVWERQMAELGDYLSPGQTCGLLVELSPLKVKIQLTEKQLPLVKSGDLADIALATGETVQGRIDFIEAKADPATRTFIGEISVANSDYALKAGVTATVRVKSGKTLAQRIPSNVLTLDDNGTVGVRYVDRNNVVRFATVNIIDETSSAAWVTGLPDQADIIVEGQDFVAIGMTVDPQVNYNGTYNGTGQ